MTKGRSTLGRVSSRPSAKIGSATWRTRSTGLASGNGPEASATPGTCISSVTRASVAPLLT